MKSSKFSQTTFLRFFIALISAAILFVPATADAVRLEPTDLVLFTIDLPEDLKEEIDEESRTMILATSDMRYVFTFSPISPAKDFDPEEGVYSALDEMGINTDDLEIISVNAGGQPFVGTVITEGNAAAMLGYLVDYQANIGVFMFFSTDPADIETLMLIASSIRVTRYN